MKRIFTLILACLFLTGCGISVQPQTHQIGHNPPSVIQTSAPTVAPTEDPIPANPYGPLDFGKENGYLTCLAGQSMLGIDCSYWQGQVNWQKVKDAGIEFVMLRIGQRGSEQGILAEDKMVHKYYQGAKAAGLKIGGYIFSQAINPEEAVEEAEFMLNIVKDWDVDMPLVFDWEYLDATARTGNMDARTLTDCAIAFCETIEAAGYEPMIYFNIDHARTKLYLEELLDYKFWLALYDTPMTYQYKIDMWQYTCTGSVPGISGNVDINVYLQYE